MYTFRRATTRRKSKRRGEKKFLSLHSALRFHSVQIFLDKQRTKLFIIFLIPSFVLSPLSLCRFSHPTLSLPPHCVQKRQVAVENLNNSNKITLNWIIISIRHESEKEATDRKTCWKQWAEQSTEQKSSRSAQWGLGNFFFLPPETSFRESIGEFV